MVNISELNRREFSRRQFNQGTVGFFTWLTYQMSGVQILENLLQPVPEIKKPSESSFYHNVQLKWDLPVSEAVAQAIIDHRQEMDTVIVGVITVNIGQKPAEIVFDGQGSHLLVEKEAWQKPYDGPFVDIREKSGVDITPSDVTVSYVKATDGSPLNIPCAIIFDQLPTGLSAKGVFKPESARRGFIVSACDTRGGCVEVLESSMGNPLLGPLSIGRKISRDCKVSLGIQDLQSDSIQLPRYDLLASILISQITGISMNTVWTNNQGDIFPRSQSESEVRPGVNAT